MNKYIITIASYDNDQPLGYIWKVTNQCKLLWVHNMSKSLQKRIKKENQKDKEEKSEDDGRIGAIPAPESSPQQSKPKQLPANMQKTK